jgi:hypothetical protein
MPDPSPQGGAPRIAAGFTFGADADADGWSLGGRHGYQRWDKGLVVEGKAMGDEGGAYLDIFNIFGGLLFKIYNDEMAPNGKTKEPFWLGGAAASMAVCFSMFRLR